MIKRVLNNNVIFESIKNLIGIIFILLGHSGLCQNPVFTQRYTADPTALAHNGRVYIWASHDVDGQNPYQMNDITCMSSADMVNWTDHGEVFKTPEKASWATHAWAPSVVYRNNKFYLYFGDGNRGIGVAVSDSPTGPFVDAIGSALITKSTPGANVSWVFDPSVFIDDDGQAYCVFGGGNNGGDNARIIKLNDDMISVNGAAISVLAEGFFEGAYLNKRTVNGVSKYYYSYFRNDGQQGIDYMISDNPMSGWEYGGRIQGQLGTTNGGNNLHASLFEFQSKWYIAYHTRQIARDRDVQDLRQRSVCVDELYFNDDYSIKRMVSTSTGSKNIGYVNPFMRIEAETMATQSYLLPGIETAPSTDTDNGRAVTEIDNGDWIKIGNVNFGDGAETFSARVSSAVNGGSIQILLDSETGILAGSCVVPVTGSNNIWQTVNATLSGATGVHDVYLKFVGTADGFLFDFNWWECSLVSNGQLPYNELTKIPGIIEAENYDLGGEAIAYHDINTANSGEVYRTDGVDISEKAIGQFVLTDTENGEWLEYSVYVDKPGIYACDIQYTAATSNSKIGGLFINAKTVLFSNINLTKTANLTDFETQTIDAILLEKGVFKFRLNIEEGGCEIDKIEFKFVSNPPVIQKPYLDIVREIPGVVEAEDYDEGDEGLSYHDSDDTNNYGQYRTDGVDVGLINTDEYSIVGVVTGEWVEYTVNVLEDAMYDVDFIYASKIEGVIGMEFFDESIMLFNDLDLVTTSDWNTYQTITKSSVALTKGIHILRINVLARGFNLDKMEFRKTESLSINNNTFKNTLKVFPVPSFDGQFHLSETCKWQVYSVLGVKISDGESNNVNISNFSKGMYFIKTKYGTRKVLFN
ncbi:carbohydrate-binding protein [Formosa sp. PL04]|uniref:carbohydrate-binding protein n=1 Tax=Formosa sp. PL04 TaxID=3081755 RepID=UPI002981A883|nr:carbohydrate-binding protein [Formosa sp. PL04]MDW5288125.1 carbohydrate-binding protein [Formosa sp. PL04]